MSRFLGWICGVVALSSACEAHLRSEVRVVAPASRYLISMTSGVVDARGLVAPERLEIVGSFEHEPSDCVEGPLDISEAVNAALEKAKGDAVINLRIGVRGSASCTNLRVSGEIVRVRP
ncbi:MAG: hypothetical protein U1E65_21310 [Myxococcota bacterium]